MPASDTTIVTSTIKDLTTAESDSFVLAKLPKHIYDELVNEMLSSGVTPMEMLPANDLITTTTASKTKRKPKTKRYKSNTLNVNASSAASEEKNREKIIKGSWTQEEDDILRELVGKHGPKRWSFIAEHLPHRVGKQCRERWLNHLDPTINKGEWSDLEDKIIVVMQNKMGNRWARISKCLKGRTPNSVKNHWNSTLQKKAEALRKKYLVGVEDPLADFEKNLRREIERVTHDVQHLSKTKREKKKKSPSTESGTATNDRATNSTTTTTHPKSTAGTLSTTIDSNADSLTQSEDDDDDFRLHEDMLDVSLDGGNTVLGGDGSMMGNTKRALRKQHF